MEFVDVSELLDYAEAKANQQSEELKKSNKSDGGKDGDNDTDMGGVYPDPEPRLRKLDTARDPRRLDRPDFVGDGNSKNRYTEERDENDERRARRSQGRGDDDAANGASDRDSANGSGRLSKRGNTRSRSPTRPGSRGSRGSGGDRYRARDDRRDDPDRYYRPDGRRYPSPERGGRERRGSRGRYQEDDRHGGRRDDRGGRRDDRGGRDSRRSPHGGGRKRKSPEPTDDERDRRTVFVQQLAARLRTKQLIEFFDNGAGKVKDAQVVKDRVSGRSKG